MSLGLFESYIAVATYYVDLFRRPDDRAAYRANILNATVLGGLPPTLDSGRCVFTLAIFVIITLDGHLHMLIARGKPKSNIYQYTESAFNLEVNNATSIDREIPNALTCIEKIINTTFTVSKHSTNYRAQLYKLLMQYTITPIEIQTLIDKNLGTIHEISRVLKDEICMLSDAYDTDVLWDMNNLTEKYFSISYPDKSIFTKGREAYPLRLVATDEEESKVEQIAGYEEPLQSKAIFFDNKKMLQKSEVCDGITFCYTRINPLYFGKTFKVVMIAKPRYFMVKFPEFTVEEDIQHVLSDLFDA